METNTSGIPYNPAAIAIIGGSITGVTGVPTLLAQSAVAVISPTDTTLDTLATVTVPANTLGLNGRLRIKSVWQCTNSVNNKTVDVRFAGNQVATTVQTSVNRITIWTEIANQNATNSQFYESEISTSGAALSLAPATLAVDTTAAQNITFTSTKGLGSELLQLSSYVIEIIK